MNARIEHLTNVPPGSIIASPRGVEYEVDRVEPGSMNIIYHMTSLAARRHREAYRSALNGWTLRSLPF